MPESSTYNIYTSGPQLNEIELTIKSYRPVGRGNHAEESAVPFTFVASDIVTEPEFM